MAVVLDALGSADFYSAGNTNFTFTNLTIGTGASNYALVAMFSLNPGTGVASVTWNGVSLTLIGSQANLAGVPSWTTFLYGLVAPASGPQTLAITLSGAATEAYIDALSFSGVDQTGGSTTFANVQTAVVQTTIPLSCTTTGTASDYTVASVAMVGGTHVSAMSGTPLFNDTTGSQNASGQYSSGVGTITSTLTSATGAQAAMAAVTVKAASGGGGAAASYGNMTMMGVG